MKTTKRFHNLLQISTILGILLQFNLFLSFYKLFFLITFETVMPWRVHALTWPLQLWLGRPKFESLQYTVHELEQLSGSPDEADPRVPSGHQIVVVHKID